MGETDSRFELMDERVALAEQSVAGAVLIDSRAFPVAAEILRAEDFQLSYCQDIFRIAGGLFARGQTIDPVVLFEELKKSGSGIERQTFLQLMEVTPTAANTKAYAEIVRENARRRAVRDLCHAILEDNAGGGELLEKLSRGTEEILSHAVKTGVSSMERTVESLLKDTMAYMEGKRKPISTGFPKLDNGLGGGLTPGMLVVIAGRPGMGKTTFALALAEHIARQGAVLYITLEMSGKQLAAKLYAKHTGVPARKILVGNLLEEESYKLLEKQREVQDINLTINDRMGVTVEEIGLMARSVKGLSCLIVDHLGLVQAQNSRRQSRYEQVTEISGALKRLALNLPVPVLALSQLSRENEKRKNPRPQLSDLRESGSIEQDADAVLLLHRGDYYNGSEDKNPWDPSLLEVHVAKTRFASNTKVMFNAYLGADVVEEMR